MQPGGWPLTRDLVLVGGGHAAALVLRAWGMDPLAGVRLTLINPDPVAPYTGMLPGLVAGHYRRADLMIDLMRLGRHAGARVILGVAEGIDREARLIHVPGRPPVAYDVALLDIGIGSAPPALAGFAAHGVAAKPLGPFAARWEGFVAEVEAGRAPASVAVLGGGIGGVELALAMAWRLRARVPRITLIDPGEVLKGVAPATRRQLLAHLARAGVVVMAGATPARVEAAGVVLGDGRTVEAALVVGVAGARPQGWLGQTGLDLHEGFVRVTPTLQAVNDPAIFAAGDCAHLDHAPRPKAGVFAVRAAPILHHNLRAALSGGRMRAFRPQRDYLKLVSTGARHAVADRSGFRLGGAWLWRWKDRIDRRFMARFAQLPSMPAPALPRHHALGLARVRLETPPLCGGCGAKVGPGALREGLAALPAPARADVLAGAGGDAAVIAQGGGVQLISTDQLRALVADPVAMARIAALHALGDIWAGGGAPQVALAQIVLPRLSERLQARTIAEITAEAAAVMAEAGAVLAGGHTLQGPEFQIGFTVTGLATGTLGKRGARPGDRLILTRAIGSGAVMAALMADRPPPAGPDAPMLGEAAAEALRRMARPGAAAAAILAPRAHAMTDATGFGLAGHLGEMLAPDGLGARLLSAAIPLLPLAAEIVAAGTEAHLAAANRAGAPPVIGAGPVEALLHDPQTAGGFIAALPPEAAAEALVALHAAGEVHAADIGEVTAGPLAIHLG
ncbi:MAG: selenide, water dikinase SelD [Gemmobacter sp.]